MIFYYAPKTVALAAHITLEEAQAEYEARRLDFSSQEQQSEYYLKINPKGRVPSLDTGAGILTETPAILAFIAQQWPDANLAPLQDNFQFAKIQEFNLYLCSTVHVAHAHRVRGSRWVDDEAAIKAMQRKVPQNMHDCFSLIENQLFQGPWLMGEHYTICDPYLFTIENWLAGDGVNMADFPKIAAHHERMRERPAVKEVLQVYDL